MLYLLDANTLIHAKNLYYKFEQVPEFWDWLVYQGEQGIVKIPVEIHEEIVDPTTPRKNKDNLALWAESTEVKEHLVFEEESDQIRVAQITYGGYTATPSEDDLEKMGNDPFLLSYALADIDKRTIVTTEHSKPSRQGANRHIPDVANNFNIRCINTFRMLEELSFSTGWKS
ncbi:MAG: DUF4411 family protein [Candidatus Thiodiazotropha sp. (ex Lucinoma borealis)]|nr:DUF4411 family protein [Candidatus Thiodiazotropha sp. (ex Lucinoma borealis)]